MGITEYEMCDKLLKMLERIAKALETQNNILRFDNADLMHELRKAKIIPNPVKTTKKTGEAKGKGKWIKRL